MSTVFITGANRGLGLEFVKEFTEKKYEVIATCRNLNSSDDLSNFAKINSLVQLLSVRRKQYKQCSRVSNSVKKYAY